MGESVEIQIIAVDAATDIISRIGAAFGPMGEAAAIAIGGAVAAITQFVTAGAEAEDTMGRFNTLVDSSPLVGYKDEMLKLANALSLTTKFETDNIVAAEGQLSLYTNIGQNIFPEATKATLNLATLMGGDATSAAQMLGRALEDISGGSLTMLARQRLLTKEQADSAKSMAEYGQSVDVTSQMTKKQTDALSALMTPQQKATNAAAAQAYVLDILNGKIGDLATNMAQTGTGPMTTMNNKFQDMKEQIGTVILNALNPLITRFSDWVTQNTPQIIAAGTDIAQNFANLVTNIVNYLVPAFNSMQVWWTTYGPQISNTVGRVMDSIIPPLEKLYNSIVPSVMQSLGGFFKFLQANGPEMNRMFEELAQIIGTQIIPIVTRLGPIIGAVLDPFIKQTEYTIKIVETLIDALAQLLGLSSAVSAEEAARQATMASMGGGGYNSSYDAYLSQFPARASGGPVMAGQTYMVGEQGPEPFTPAINGYISPAGSGGSAAGGAVIHFHYSPGISLGSEQEILSWVNKGIRRAQADGRLPSSGH